MYIKIDENEYKTLAAAEPHFAGATHVVVDNCPLFVGDKLDAATDVVVYNCPRYIWK